MNQHHITRPTRGISCSRKQSYLSHHCMSFKPSTAYTSIKRRFHLVTKSTYQSRVIYRAAMPNVTRNQG